MAPQCHHTVTTSVQCMTDKTVQVIIHVIMHSPALFQVLQLYLKLSCCIYAIFIFIIQFQFIAYIMGYKTAGKFEMHNTIKRTSGRPFMCPYDYIVCLTPFTWCNSSPTILILVTTFSICFCCVAVCTSILRGVCLMYTAPHPRSCAVGFGPFGTVKHQLPFYIYNM